MPEVDATCEYRSLPDLPGYSFGSNGSVWACWTRGRNPRPSGTYHPLKLFPTPDGYFITRFKTAAGMKTLKISHLILLAFVGPRPEGTEARHLNGIRDDNRATNLAWGTKSQNEIDKVLHGNNNLAKLTPDTVREILSLLNAGLTPKEVAPRFGITAQHVRRLRRGGERWCHLR